MPIYLIVPILFFSISSLFSMLGIGGSVLYIPILYWLGLDFQTEAIPMGLLLNIISSSTAAITYAKNNTGQLGSSDSVWAGDDLVCAFGGMVKHA